ncbi:hypothetical protein EG329_002978 [Mollisiaceae sp. DMI_Dod_QoI]|nr:hypothetical protein EG329_002978 [Helotiales sp. DMI_Dod_QoI]
MHSSTSTTTYDSKLRLNRLDLHYITLLHHYFTYLCLREPSTTYTYEDVYTQTSRYHGGELRARTQVLEGAEEASVVYGSDFIHINEKGLGRRGIEGGRRRREKRNGGREEKEGGRRRSVRRGGFSNIRVSTFRLYTRQDITLLEKQRLKPYY